MINLDFRNIRTHNGSQAEGFEELICQLAGLNKPKQGKRFVRKGRGADAGVECYWILDDDSEIAWQAKYFVDPLPSNGWSQLDESFSAALAKHPNMKEYVVCIPLDKPDGRVTREGKQATTVEDVWKGRVETWKHQAKNQGRNIAIRFWGKHEITSYLSRDDADFAGRALYWFNSPLLRSETFEQIVVEAEASLGERYTSELHIDLPISDMFEGLCLTPQWWALLDELFEKLEITSSRFFRRMSESSLSTEARQAKLSCETVLNELREFITYKSMPASLEDIQNKTKLTLEQINALLIVIDKIDNKENKQSSKEWTRDSFFKVHGSFNDLYKFLTESACATTQKKGVLIHGAGGIGKSHLLCDVAIKRVAKKFPTVLLLGAQYQGGSPIKLIKGKLDLDGYRDEVVLGALDAAGEASGQRTLIMVDAINEGRSREDWQHNIVDFLVMLSRFKNIAVAITCRDTYLNYIIPEHVDIEKHLVKVKHSGFEGCMYKAAEQYLAKYGIARPSVPILPPEFVNPLFLKSCCKALKENKQTQFPKGMQGLTSVVDFYLDSIERVIARKKKYNPAEKVVRSAIDDFSAKMFPEHLSGVPINDARCLIRARDPVQEVGVSLFDELVEEGVLSEDTMYGDNGEVILIVKFTYERFNDIFIAKLILSNFPADSTDIGTVFSPTHPLGNMLSEKGIYSIYPLLEVLEIFIPEKFGVELDDLLPSDVKRRSFDMDDIFIRSAIWRTPKSITQRTTALLTELNKDHKLNVLIRLATEPDHPWNAEFLHSELVDMDIAERDHYWSTYLAFCTNDEDRYDNDTAVKILIEWAYSEGIALVEEERIRLYAITLFWFLTTSNREIRDRATKSLIRIFSVHPKLLPELIERFCTVNDLYLVERLYAVVYGTVCHIDDDNLISKLARLVYTKVFSIACPTPHILLRDYARGVLEYASKKNLISDIEPKTFRPPYKSQWPLDIPTEDDINNLSGDEFSSRIKSSLMGYPGDFGNYTMNCVSEWSLTPLSKPRQESGYEMNKAFAEEHLEGALLQEYLDMIAPYAKSHVQETANVPTTTLNDENFDIKINFVESLSDDELEELLQEFKPQIELKQTEEDALCEKVKSELDGSIRSYFEWIWDHKDDTHVSFPIVFARKWVCKRAYDYGWTEERFSNFEHACLHARVPGPLGSAVERMGKKYQWLALHELLAYMSDNLHKTSNEPPYNGPGQIYRRDIDPTHWLRGNYDNEIFNSEQLPWWQPYQFPFDSLIEASEQEAFLEDKEQNPDFSKLLQVTEPNSKKHWTVLSGSCYQSQRKIKHKNCNTVLKGRFFINAVCVSQNDLPALEKIVKDRTYRDLGVEIIPSIGERSFLGEYPWHPINNNVTGWRNLESSDIKYFTPIVEYQWVKEGSDYSLDKTLSLKLPARKLIDELALERSITKDFEWECKGEPIFFDPSIEMYGPSCALISSPKLEGWLNKNNMELVWIVDGENFLWNDTSSKVCGRVNFHAFYTLVEGEPVGELWYEN